MTSQAYLRCLAAWSSESWIARHGDPERVVDRLHPFGVAAGQVVVDRDEVDAASGERVEEDGERGGEGLALAGLHLGDGAVVQDHATDQLNVEVALAERAATRLAGQRKGLGQEIVERLPVAGSLAQRVGLDPQLVVAEKLHLRLDLADRGSPLLVRLELAALPDAQRAGDHVPRGGHRSRVAVSAACPVARPRDRPPTGGG